MKIEESSFYLKKNFFLIKLILKNTSMNVYDKEDLINLCLNIVRRADFID